MDEAEIYVRDHLLIEFMQLYFIENEYGVGELLDRRKKMYEPTMIENLYKEWIEWLKKMEENH